MTQWDGSWKSHAPLPNDRLHEMFRNTWIMLSNMSKNCKIFGSRVQSLLKRMLLNCSVNSLQRNMSHNCSDFRRKRNIYAWCGFLFSQYSAIEVIDFNKKIIPHSNRKCTRYFTSDRFLQFSGNLKIANSVMLWTSLWALWRFYSWWNQIEWRLANRSHSFCMTNVFVASRR